MSLFDIPREQLEAGWEAEEDRLRKAEFVDWLHRYRAQWGAPAVSDEVAVEAFNLLQNFLAMWTAASNQGARLDWSLKMKAWPAPETPAESAFDEQQRNSEWDRQREQIAAGLAKNR